MSKVSFTQHPAEVGETYGAHALTALGFAWRLQIASLAALLHALLPFLCVKTASRAIGELHGRMVMHRVSSPPASRPARRSASSARATR